MMVGQTPAKGRVVPPFPFDALPDDAAGLDPEFDEWDETDPAREGLDDLASILRGWGSEN